MSKYYFERKNLNIVLRKKSKYCFEEKSQNVILRKKVEFIIFLEKNRNIILRKSRIYYFFRKKSKYYFEKKSWNILREKSRIYYFEKKVEILFLVFIVIFTPELETHPWKPSEIIPCGVSRLSMWEFTGMCLYCQSSLKPHSELVCDAHVHKPVCLSRPE